MLKTIKDIFTNKKIYLGLLGLVVAFASFLFIMDAVVMPAFTNYNEGITVPDVTEISLVEAQELLSSYGLRFEVTDRRSNSAFPEDYVIDQTPTPAEIVKPNRKIYLTVNTESHPTVVVPEVVNLSLRNARIQLENYGLSVGTVSYQSSRFKHSVLQQSVPGGRTVEKGTVVDLVVSDGLGDRMVNMPDIIGLSLTEAQQQLRESGLHIGGFEFRPSREASPNTVIDFSPKQNRVVEGETIDLVISERFDVREESESGAIRVDTSYVQGSDSLELNNRE